MMINYNVGAKLADVASTLESVETLPKPYDLYYAVKNEGEGAGWSYRCAGLGVQTIRDAATLLAGNPQAMSEGAFRMGARAMREAIEAKFAKWIADNGEICMPVLHTARAAAADTPLPDFPAQPEPPKQVWAWWSGGDGEWFTNGPCATREEAIGELCGEGGHLVEALAGVVHFSAERLIADQYFEDDQGFDYDHSEPDRVGGADVIAAADAELQALLNGWLARWGHTFVKPSLFAATRNAEYVEPDAAEASA